MELLLSVKVWIVANWAIVAPLLWAVSNEVLAHNPNWASNSMIQLIMGIFKSKLPPAQ